MKAGLLATHLAVVVIAAPVLAQAQQPGPNQAPEGSSSPTRQSPPGVPPADQPLLRHMPQPVVSVEGGGGIVGFVGGAGKPGPGWNLRVTGALSDRWAVEGNYLGSVNERSDTKDTLVMTGIDLGVRYNLALPDQLPVQPFVVGGAGYAGFAGRNGDPAMLVVPLVVGAERLLTPNIKVGARFSYRPAFFDDLSTPTTARGEKPGADTWSVLAQIGGGF